VGKTVVMSSYFRPEEPGRYIVKGYVLYGGKTTDTKESVINVNPEGTAIPEDTNYLAFLISAVVVVLIIVILLKRRLGRRAG